MIAMDSNRIQGLDLLTGSLQTFYETRSNESILPGGVEDWSTLETRGEALFFVTGVEEALQLVSYDQRAEEKVEYSLKTRKAVGPFRLGGRIGVYTGSHLCLVEDSGLTLHEFPPGVHPYLESSLGSLRPPYGRTVFAASPVSSALYIPVETGGAPGFLCYMLKNSMLQRIPIQVGEGAGYCPDEEGGLVVAQKGRISVYRNAGLEVRKEQRDLIALGPPFHSGQLTIGYTRTEGGYESVTFFCGDEQAEFPMARFRETGLSLDAIGFYYSAGALLFAYRLSREKVKIGIWDL